ncbi:SDR family oxidoreductase [Pseudonocardia zijingensis]|jgi:NAD(P)-dependent dehydrogenase (short-subunit alcohol dehydrogenase family)|uniref:SDR family NAD(P)-dependent oxidoreductase n=1 Tax=Pseudonocardia zijingensis TaxID=153376 RepID=A0ABN1NAQ0_9PSEU
MSPRRVLVTGAAGRIGTAIAERFCREGDTVVGVDFRPDDLESAMKPFVTAGTATTVVADLRDATATDELIPQVWESTGPVDVLVNVAAYIPVDRFIEMTAARWDEVMAVNLRAPMQLTVALARLARDADRTASVVTISSGAATRARPGAAHYTTSKAAVEMMVRNAAIELAPDIRVNAVSPGFVPVDSPVNRVSAEYLRTLTGNPMGRPGHPGDIANAVHWIAGDEASWVTGSVLRVDGGATAGNAALPLQNAGEDW